MSISEHPCPERTPYQLLGGEKAVRQLANRFYDIMATDPKAAELLAIHPQPMDSIRQRFFEFLSGWLGGPGLFEQKYGHPRLRARHLSFTVNASLRDQWMYCMEKALADEVKNPQLRKSLYNAFAPLATHMINQ
ncbi:group II truncated hemoglobin [Gallaecimonas mangrovi]|uniref:group II truncated hemoglobin n=1 Tax=Gallaecimonas mangrovi TaxID=2291597 RepID=UPI000E1FB943|nr:group II truncated hemoglobin [Gallaecimonas mangrovi]